ncbi:hypothetical protein GCM10020254_57490 [Streptomyces goshikiensis]
MPHHPTHPADALTPLRYGDAILHPPTLPAPRLPLAEIPAGVQYVTLPDGTRTLAYTSAPEPQPAQTIPAWAKTTALLAPPRSAAGSRRPDTESPTRLRD